MRNNKTFIGNWRQGDADKFEFVAHWQIIKKQEQEKHAEWESVGKQILNSYSMRNILYKYKMYTNTATLNPPSVLDFTLQACLPVSRPDEVFLDSLKTDLD